MWIANRFLFSRKLYAFESKHLANSYLYISSYIMSYRHRSMASRKPERSGGLANECGGGGGGGGKASAAAEKEKRSRNVMKC